MWTILIAPAAARDLLAARQWLTQDGSGLRAARRLAAIGAAIQDLRRDPHRWPVGDHEGVRERPVEGYRIAYELNYPEGRNEKTGVVKVLRVFGPYQNRTDPRRD